MNINISETSAKKSWRKWQSKGMKISRLWHRRNDEAAMKRGNLRRNS